MKEFIEIPFGAKDSELEGWEYNIPEGYTASIENDKIIVKKEESEDEKIRKEILKYCKQGSRGVRDILVTPKDFDRWIAWLENQGEQEEPQVYETEDGEVITYSETDGYKVVEPKFKVGGWIVNNRSKDVFFIKSINSGYCSLEDTKGNIYSPCLPFESDFHLWTIQDARDGDVLQLGNVTAIFKEFLGNNRCTCYCSVCKGKFKIPVDDGFDNVYGWYDTYPATKEQRDLLFQKMNEAGYEWDAEKKELKKIEQDSAWTEEDERMCNASIRACQYMVENFENSTWDYEDAIDWLKSLKNCVQPQWKPSEEQIQALEYQVNSTCKGSWQYRASKELLEQLKKL